MPSTLFQDKAENLKKRVADITRAMQMMDNSELDLAPEVNRVALSGAALPGFGKDTFDGEAVFAGNGEVLAVGVRHRGGAGPVDLMVRRDGALTRVTERRYHHGHSLTLIVTAVFNLAGDLLGYEEIF